MPTGYFDTVWRDIKNSPGWFGKLLVLSLVSFIPIFGVIVVYGYLFGWARDIAWRAHTPLPGHIFGNEDGRLYSRGFFVLVIMLVCMLIPFLVNLLIGFFSGLVSGLGLAGLDGVREYGVVAVPWLPFGMFAGIMGLALFAVSIATTFLALLFSWVGSMRMTVYGRLSAGVQFKRMWAMIRHDFGGLLRIFGMVVLLGIAAGIVMFLFVMIVVVLVLLVGIIVAGGNLAVSPALADGSLWGMMGMVGGLVIVLMLAYLFVSAMVNVFVEMMTVRALGYWMQQFDVGAWRGQDDPMPFEG